jgi:hypothetical protein
MANVFDVNSGYRTRYPHVAVTTNRPALRKGAGPDRQAWQKLQVERYGKSALNMLLCQT